jgi:hypothetical protein
MDKLPIEIFLTPEQIKKLLEPQFRYKPEAHRESLVFLHWLGPLLAGLLAGLGGAWGTSRVLTKKHSLPAPRVERLGLGADGKGGVWFRDVPPWEK